MYDWLNMNEIHKYWLLYSLIVVSTLPFLILVHPPTSWDFTKTNLPSIAFFYSAFCGYVGISLLLWMYILGTRSVTGLFFKDIPKTLRIHRWLGTYGILLIFLHPILIAISEAKNLLAYTFIPNTSTNYEKIVTYGRVAFMLLALTYISSAILRSHIAFRPWKYIHLTSYIILPLSFLHAPKIGSSFASSIVQAYWYSFVAIFLLFTAIRLRHIFGFGKVRYKITKQSQISKDVFVMHLKSTSRVLHIKSGQYVYVQLGLLHEEHPFTVVDYDNNAGTMVIAYKVFGAYTHKMTRLVNEELVYIDGPYGTFTEDIIPRSANQQTVFIAGGIGITPFVKHITQSSNNEDTWLFYANQTRQTAVFRDYLREHLGEKYVDIMSREESTESENDERGRLRTEIISKYLGSPTDSRYYICGPKGLIDTAKYELAQLGVPQKNIHAEEFAF